LIEIAQAHSPVFDMLTNGLPVTCALAQRRLQTAA
jgi:hypothetical protein